MNKKNLAEQYSIKEYERLNDSNPVFEDNLCFSIIDIEAAFNAGRESIVEKISELKWEEINLYRHCGIYLEVCRAHTRLEDFLIRIWSDPRDIELLSNNFLMGGFSKGGFKTVEEAKSYATKVYKERIKEVLEL